jgi:hypothetical protein
VRHRVPSHSNWSLTRNAGCNKNIFKSVHVAASVSGVSNNSLANFDIDYSIKYLPEFLMNVQIQSAI